MLIEVPDSLLHCMKKMPPQKIEKKRRRMQNFNVLSWIGANQGYIAAVIAYRAIAKRSMELGFTNFDPDTETWQGVDYHED